MDSHRDQFGVEPLCSVIGFPVSTYYATKKRAGEPSEREIRDEELIPLIRVAWVEKGKRLYGAAEWVYWYNHERLHSWCGHVPPMEYEQAYRDGLLMQPPSAA